MIGKNSHCKLTLFRGHFDVYFQEPYCNLRSDTSQFRRENIKTTHYGIQSVKFLGPKIWAMEPQNIKNCKSLQEFKRLIKV